MNLSDRMLRAAAIVGRRTPLILQTETAECGLACLAMIAGRYGHRVDLPALRQRFNLSLRGTTLHDLVRIASDMRLATRALRAELPHLRQLRLPVSCTGTTTISLCSSGCAGAASSYMT